MKALQTRSPIHLYYYDSTLSNVTVNIWLKVDPALFDTEESSNYELQSDSVNRESIFEISDLLRSANQYEYDKDFYQKRDTAIYVLCKADLFNDDDNLIEVRHNFLRIRDGYVERQEQSQILNNTIPSDVREWNFTASQTVITKDRADPFGGNNAYLIEADSDQQNSVQLEAPINSLGLHTVSVWIDDEVFVSGENKLEIQVGADSFSMDENVNNVYTTTSNVFDIDVVRLTTWKKLSFVVSVQENDLVKLIIASGSFKRETVIFNPTVIKGNYLNQNAKDLILQDNFTSYTNLNITPKIAFDRKKANTDYLYTQTLNTLFENDAELQSVSLSASSNNVLFDRMDGTTTLQETRKIVLYECKYDPVKVTFLNRFGVLQDLVFFKKRVDSSSTDSESYKADVITSGEVFPHLGQRRVYNKQAEAKVKLSSGFYPESFNTVFKQLIFSEMVFIDDEPVVISTSTFRQKTQIDDKLINYDIDFDFANDDINSIR